MGNPYRYLKFYERYTCGLIIIYIAGVKTVVYAGESLLLGFIC